MSDVALEYRVQARNLSHASENRIHDDDIARRFGFRGGLVPGVEVYAYMTHLPVARWGVEWLERGTAECRFSKPVYDGKLVTVSATSAEAELSIAVESEGEQCASGAAALPTSPPFVLTLARSKDERPPAIETRPEANEESLAEGRHLSCDPMHITHEYLEQYLADIQETEPLYAREKLVHPALYLRLSNAALKENVKLGPWIHAASSIRHCGLARAGTSLAAQAQVAANYERKGHRFVELDIVIVADASRAVAQVRHTAIYKLRQD
jgi:acyl dehydratase